MSSIYLHEAYKEPGHDVQVYMDKMWIDQGIQHFVCDNESFCTTSARVSLSIVVQLTLTCLLMRNFFAPIRTSSYPEDGMRQLKSAKQPLKDCMISSMSTRALYGICCVRPGGTGDLTEARRVTHFPEKGEDCKGSCKKVLNGERILDSRDTVPGAIPWEYLIEGFF